jgi:hypothetical protein
MQMRGITALLLIAITFAPAAFPNVRQLSPHGSVEQVEKYRKTELYFGTGKPDGTEITDEEWQDFVSNEVTPRFPDGFTVVAATGQYRTSRGEIVREHSRMLIILYPKRRKTEVGEKVEQIRKAYCHRFNQESVMRVDSRQSVDVDF